MILPLYFILVLIAWGSGVCQSQTVGWKSYVQQEITEYTNIPLKWDSDCPTDVIPQWLTGQLVKNGPGRSSFGGERIHTSWMDGFAKLHSFKFNGNTSDVLVSGQFIKTPIYNKCLEQKDLIPYVTLAKVGPTDWTWSETFEALKNKFDNTNVMVWKYKSHEDGVEDDFIANTDAPYVSKFDLNTLAYRELMFPSRKSMASCAHPLIEPGTDHTINFGVTYDWKMKATFEVYRYTTFKDAQLVASFIPRRMAYIHSFSVTENYAVFFFYPMRVSLWQMVTSGMHPIDALVWDENTPTDIYAVNLKTGVVDVTTETRAFFSAHHVNAYEDGGKIVVDLCQTPFENMAGYMLFENIWAAEETGRATSKLRRFLIEKATGLVTETDIPRSPESSPLVDTFDFPTINEAYRGRRYCFAYGVIMLDYSRHHLVKRSLCDPSKDKMLGLVNHYYSEMNFVPNPDAKEEDDGILTTVAYDGENQKSYLMILDAKDFRVRNKAFLPYRVPMHFHGNFFPGV